MTLEERVAMFPELDYFKRKQIRNFATYCLKILPEYFFHIPASSSGKYHPAFALGEGGLVRHTRAAMNIARMMHDAGMIEYYDDTNVSGLVGDAAYDAALLALLVHDGLKSGTPNDFSSVNPPSEHTIFGHPILASKFLLNCASAYPFEESDSLYIINAAAEAVKSHMGKWNISKYSTVILPTPLQGDWLARMVHICDYFASRKELPFDFTAIPALGGN